METKPQSTFQAPVSKSLRKLSVQNEYLPWIIGGRKGKEATKRKATQGKAHRNARKSRPGVPPKYPRQNRNIGWVLPSPKSHLASWNGLKKTGGFKSENTVVSEGAIKYASLQCVINLSHQFWDQWLLGNLEMRSCLGNLEMRSCL